MAWARVVPFIGPWCSWSSLFDCFRFYRRIDGRAQVVRIDLWYRHWLIVNKDAGRGRNPEHGALLLIGRDPLLYFLARQVFFELLHVHTDRAGVGFKQRMHIRRGAPDCLLAIKHVVHLPKTVLHGSRLRRLGCILRVLVVREREMVKEQAYLAAIIALE